MGRHKEIGLNYFPLDVDTFQDIKIRKLIKYQRGQAFTVYALLLCLIYKDGYYMLWDEELPFILSEQTGFEEAYIREVIKCCLALGLFSKELYDKEKVLTSRGIQERYQFIATKLCRRASSINEYSLISSEENAISSEEKTVSSEEMQINSMKMQQRKGKVKEKKEKDNKLSSPLTPQGGRGGDFLSSNLSQKDGIPRNFDGLCESMKRLGISQSEQDQISKLSNYGAIGNPVWKYIQQCFDSIGKSTYDKSRIKIPGRYIIAKMKEEQHDT